MADDPFTTVHKQIWTALLAYPPFANNVRVGDRIDLTTDAGAARRRIHQPGSAGMPVDAPQVELDQSAFRMTLKGVNSRAALVVQSFNLSIESGKQNILTLNQAKWWVFKAMARAGDDLGLHGLVRGWDIVQAQDNTTANQSGARIGFDALLTIQVEMYVSRDSLLAD